MNCVKLNRLDKLVLRLLLWRGRAFLKRLETLFNEGNTAMKITSEAKGVSLLVKVEGFEHDKTTTENTVPHGHGSGSDLTQRTTEVKLGEGKPVFCGSVDFKCEEETSTIEFDKDDYSRLMAQVEKVNATLVEGFLTPWFTGLTDKISEIAVMAITAKQQEHVRNHEARMEELMIQREKK